MRADPSLDRLLQELRTAERPRLELRPDPAPPPAGTVALVAGSFDPMTIAHAALAEAALSRAALVVLVYSVRTLPKEGSGSPPLLSEADRIAALERFCQGRDGAVVGLCSHGLLADQVDAAHQRLPDARLSLVMGSDKVFQLLDPRWYEDRDAVLARLFEQAEVWFAVREREGAAVRSALDGLPPAWRDRCSRLNVPPGLASISSRLVRERLQQGEDVRALVPPEVRAFLSAPMHDRSDDGESFP